MSDITSNICAMSFDGQSSPFTTLKFPETFYGTHANGWGMGWYPNDGAASFIAKDSKARKTPVINDYILQQGSYRSTTFFCKVQGSADGYTFRETQPFARSFAGQDWMFMHNGNLDKYALARLHTNTSVFLEPLGRTDSELAFCYLLGKVQDHNARTLSDLPYTVILEWFRLLDPLGNADICLSDGATLLCYRGEKSQKGLYFGRISPPDRPDSLTSEMADITFSDSRDAYRTAVIVASSPFLPGIGTPMLSGQLIAVKRGYVVWQSEATRLCTSTKNTHNNNNNNNNYQSPHQQQTILVSSSQKIPTPLEKTSAMTQDSAPPSSLSDDSTQNHANHQSIINVRSLTQAPDGKPLGYRMYDVTHGSTYTYDNPVEHSTHRFHLQPIDDRIQEVVKANLTISVEGEEIQYEDVFGNQSIHYSIHKPYTQLIIKSTSQIKIYETPPDNHNLSRRHTSLPLNWMPWQRQMMMPYLLPAELPETQLDELNAYAISFAERNKHHLMDTLKDINVSIYRDFQYTPGSTSLNTTPFEVYMTRKGVCQDFANLFICLARLLGVPARYQMGYIYTGTNYENTIQSEASHAWVELYLPFIGWRGFDPTNGCLTLQEHVRVACGRQYQDATPISGTIFKGGGNETVTVDVKLEEVFQK